MTLVMLRPDASDPRASQILVEYATASCGAQEFEWLLKANLQYSLAIAGKFDTLEKLDASNQSNQRFAIGQIYDQLAPLLKDEKLAIQIDRARTTRNYLAHQFFLRAQSGLVLTDDEWMEAVEYCRSASAEFRRVSRKLQSRWDDQRAIVDRDPDAIVPGTRARFEAINRGE